jgi:hypothetical protein
MPSPPACATALSRFLAIVERGGNALPHPATLFAAMAVLVVLFSAVAAQLNLSAVHPGTGQVVEPVSLLSISGLHRMMRELVTNFTGFAPLGTVLVAMLGIAVAEGSGLIAAALKLVVLSAPPRALTLAIVFAGVMSNTGGEVGYVLLIPLAAIMFQAVGRHPLAGLAAAFAGVSGGYSANLLLGTLDPLLAGLSEEAARIIDPAYRVNASANYYFLFTSTFLITTLGTLVTERLVEPRLERRGRRQGHGQSHGNAWCLSGPRVLCRAVRRVLQLDQPWPDLRHSRRRDPADGGTGDDSVDRRIRAGVGDDQSVHGQRLSQVGDHGTGVRADADAAWLHARVHASGLPHRRQHHQPHLADDVLLRAHHRVHAAVSIGQRSWDAGRHDAAVLGDVPRRLDDISSRCASWWRTWERAGPVPPR